MKGDYLALVFTMEAENASAASVPAKSLVAGDLMQLQRRISEYKTGETAESDSAKPLATEHLQIAAGNAGCGCGQVRGSNRSMTGRGFQEEPRNKDRCRNNQARGRHHPARAKRQFGGLLL